MMIPNIDIIRIIFAIVMFVVASLMDFRNREISDKLWIIFGGVSVAMILVEPDIPHKLIEIGISLIITPVAILLWRFGIFGGADALCLIVLAALAPQTTFSDKTITPLTTLTNAALLSIAPVFVNIARNLTSIIKHVKIFEGFKENKIRKCVAMLLGHRTNNGEYYFLMEKTDADGSKKFDFSIKNAESTEFCKSHNVWAIPAIPFLIYIFAGFVIQLLIGDVVLNSFSSYVNSINHS